MTAKRAIRWRMSRARSSRPSENRGQSPAASACENLPRLVRPVTVPYRPLPPLPSPLLGLFEHFIGGLDLLEPLRRVLVAGGGVGVVGLGEAAPGGLDVVEAGVGLDLEHVQRPHLLARAGAVAGAGPGILGGLAVAVIAA